jgi:hypothetical protein
MRTFKFWGIQIDFLFIIWRVKRLTFDLPDWADDITIIFMNYHNELIQPRIKYHKGSKGFYEAKYIDLPKCKTAKQIYVTPKYDSDLNQTTNRKIVVDIYR